MAPELVAGEPATPASDLYALGAVLYELLAGRPPREVTTIADLAFDGATVTPIEELAPDAPPGLAAAIMHCLDLDPTRRPTSAAELALELEGFSEAPTRVSPDAETRVQQRARTAGLRVETTQSPRAAARFRAWPLLAAAAALVLVVVAFSLVRDGGNDEAPPPVEPVPAAETPADGARNLSSWLRENAEEPGG
jgi:hypothetical protein